MTPGREPDWSRLPFPTDGSTWRGYTEAPGGDAIFAVTAGASPRGDLIAPPTVWIEWSACEDFCRRSGVPVDAAFSVVGHGVLTWWGDRPPGDDPDQMDPIADGSTFGIELAGGSGMRYYVSRLGTDLLVYLPPHLYPVSGPPGPSIDRVQVRAYQRALSDSPVEGMLAEGRRFLKSPHDDRDVGVLGRRVVIVSVSDDGGGADTNGGNG